MKTFKYIQLFDSSGRPILSDQGVLKYPQNIKRVETIKKFVRGAKNAPKEATHFAIYKKLLNSNIKTTQLFNIND